MYDGVKTVYLQLDEYSGLLISWMCILSSHVLCMYITLFLSKVSLGGRDTRVACMDILTSYCMYV